MIDLLLLTEDGGFVVIDDGGYLVIDREPVPGGGGAGTTKPYGGYSRTDSWLREEEERAKDRERAQENADTDDLLMALALVEALAW